MTTGSIDQGDEIAVGPCRLFLLRMDEEDAVAVGRAGQATAVEEGRTTVDAPAGAGDRAEAAAAAGTASRATSPAAIAICPAERDSRPRSRIGRGDRGRASSVVHGRRDSEAPRTAEATGPERAGSHAAPAAMAAPGYAAPGQERIISSPLVVGLLAVLGVLVGMGFWLKVDHRLDGRRADVQPRHERTSRTAITARRSATSTRSSQATPRTRVPPRPG